MNDALSEYINKATHKDSGYISSGDFIRELLREHMRNNSNGLDVIKSYDTLTSKQRAEINNATLRGTAEYERIIGCELAKNPSLSHAIDQIDTEMRLQARAND